MRTQAIIYLDPSPFILIGGFYGHIERLRSVQCPMRVLEQRSAEEYHIGFALLEIAFGLRSFCDQANRSDSNVWMGLFDSIRKGYLVIS